MGLIIVDSVRFRDKREFGEFLHTLAEDHRYLSSVGINGWVITVAFAGTGVIRPTPPNLDRLLRRLGQPVDNVGGVTVPLNRCYLGALEQARALMQEVSLRIMAGIAPTHAQIDILWRALWFGGPVGHKEQVDEACLMS
ncbi:MAG: hypothetical protein JKY37_20730 [Nannocystaceae bacterium]|nr:hypothetical protein [Nannocystaceae bacterium]